ncbi:MAG: hypothetical protein BWY59_01661 [Verrucomicrobia bacterium ADurb.Bin345]|nr:MAG: hypothetical protein BWY59_01661 [Verrucomicrobia bacterium ADurb.Bin345]
MKRSLRCSALILGAGFLLASSQPLRAGPSLPITKPPVTNDLTRTYRTGPAQDPNSVQGQWFTNVVSGGLEVRSHEFYDNVLASGGGWAGAAAISGHVSSVVYDGSGINIQAFSIDATIRNDLIQEVEGPWADGSNSHSETLRTDSNYVGRMKSVRLAVEFALADSAKIPGNWADPYRLTTPPFIIAANEDLWAWYCWNPEEPVATPGDYFVPAWDFGDIAVGGSATRTLTFLVAGAGIPPADARFGLILSSFQTTNDILLNRTTSLKISTWLDDPAVDTGLPYPYDFEGGGLRNSEVSVFHDPGVELDFGDAPDSPYPTLLASDGARHLVVPGVYMGLLIDSEPDGQPTLIADGDDTNNLADEDGVTFTGSMTRGSNITFNVTASVGGYLNTWIDFNQNGNWADLGEHIFQDSLLTPGVNALPAVVPMTALVGPTYARFRFSTAMGLTYTGLAPDGEVEDYIYTIHQDPPLAPVTITNFVYSRTNSQFLLRWNVETNRIYRVETATNDLPATNMTWNQLGPHVWSPQDVQIDTNVPDRMRFYRVTVPYSP